MPLLGHDDFLPHSLIIIHSMLCSVDADSVINKTNQTKSEKGEKNRET